MNRYLHHAMDLVYEPGFSAGVYRMLNTEDRQEARRTWQRKRKPVFKER